MGQRGRRRLIPFLPLKFQPTKGRLVAISILLTGMKKESLLAQRGSFIHELYGCPLADCKFMSVVKKKNDLSSNAIARLFAISQAFARARTPKVACSFDRYGKHVTYYEPHPLPSVIGDPDSLSLFSGELRPLSETTTPPETAFEEKICGILFTLQSDDIS